MRGKKRTKNKHIFGWKIQIDLRSTYTDSKKGANTSSGLCAAHTEQNSRQHTDDSNVDMMGRIRYHGDDSSHSQHGVEWRFGLPFLFCFFFSFFSLECVHLSLCMYFLISFLPWKMHQAGAGLETPPRAGMEWMNWMNCESKQASPVRIETTTLETSSFLD